jgi:hypothetical protein
VGTPTFVSQSSLTATQHVPKTFIISSSVIEDYTQACSDFTATFLRVFLCIYTTFLEMLLAIPLSWVNYFSLYRSFILWLTPRSRVILEKLYYRCDLMIPGSAYVWRRKPQLGRRNKVMISIHSQAEQTRDCRRKLIRGIYNRQSVTIIKQK